MAVITTAARSLAAHQNEGRLKDLDLGEEISALEQGVRDLHLAYEAMDLALMEVTQ